MGDSYSTEREGTADRSRWQTWTIVIFPQSESPAVPSQQSGQLTSPHSYYHSSPITPRCHNYRENYQGEEVSSRGKSELGGSTLLSPVIREGGGRKLTSCFRNNKFKWCKLQALNGGIVFGEICWDQTVRVCIGSTFFLYLCLWRVCN